MAVASNGGGELVCYVYAGGQGCLQRGDYCDDPESCLLVCDSICFLNGEEHSTAWMSYPCPPSDC